LVAFGESPEERKEAESLLSAIWKVIIWETEKMYLVQSGHQVDGIDALEVANLL
jgi:hypothetical protein